MKGIPGDGAPANGGMLVTVARGESFWRARGLDAGTRLDLEAFFLSLDREQEFLRTPLEDVWRAKVLLLARLDGAMAGMIGIVRRFGGVPCTFLVVKRKYQRRGVARALYEARRPHCRRYGAVFSIVLAGNSSGREFFRAAGEELLADDGRHMLFVATSRRLVRLLYPLLRRLLPLLLKLARMKARRPSPEGR